MRVRNNGLKKVLYIYVGVILVLIITCTIVYNIYNKKLQESAEQSLLAAEKFSNIVPNNIVEEASLELSKSIEETLADNKEELTDQPIEDILEETNTEPEENEIEELPEVVVEEPVIEEPVKELEFMYPVEGEITKEFARENLVFSETLQEWITHNGIDIKAARTTVVKAIEEGTVTGIKTDPRYGLTVILEHRDGYKSIYSNLLTTEFVNKGDVVTKGQSLGTVGNSAAFEIADEPHLHFELLKDDEYLDPALHLK